MQRTTGLIYAVLVQPCPNMLPWSCTTCKSQWNEARCRQTAPGVNANDKEERRCQQQLQSVLPAVALQQQLLLQLMLVAVALLVAPMRRVLALRRATRMLPGSRHAATWMQRGRT